MTTLYCDDVSHPADTVLKVIVVEDEPSARRELAEAISADPRMVLVAAATDFRDGLSALDLDYDVVVVDIGLPGGSGIELIRRSFQDGTGHRLVSTVFGDEATLVNALEAGADGYILKDNESVTDAIVEVANGHVPLTPSVAVHLVRRLRPQSSDNDGLLTPREAEILNCLARGRSYQETATQLCISYHTVTDHIKAIYRKLRVNSRSSAVYQGIRSGLITLESDV